MSRERLDWNTCFISVYSLSILLQVLEVMRRCILLSSGAGKLGPLVQNMLLSDSSIHNTLFRVVCTTRQALEVCLAHVVCVYFKLIDFLTCIIHQKLYISRLSEPREIEGLEHAICSVLDIIFIMLSAFSKVIPDCITSLFIYLIISDNVVTSTKLWINITGSVLLVLCILDWVYQGTIL